MDERLNIILGYVNDWLKFAEAKNGVLLTLCGGVIFALLGNAPANTVAIWLRGIYYFSILLLFVASVVCLISFIPQIKIPWLSSIGKLSGKENVYFYGDLANYSPTELLKILHQKSGAGDNPTFTPLEIDLAGQIVTNSRIALKKYKHFSLSLWVTLVTAAVIAVYLLGVCK
jgi:hypothetical protein